MAQEDDDTMSAQLRLSQPASRLELAKVIGTIGLAISAINLAITCVMSEETAEALDALRDSSEALKTLGKSLDDLTS